MTKTYEITKLFIGGLLEGIEIIERRNYPMEVGLVVANPVGGSPYKVIACQQI